MFGGWCVVRVFISDVCIVLLCNLWVGISTHWTLPHHRIAGPVSLHHRNISHLHTGVIMGFYFKNLIKYQTQSDNLASMNSAFPKHTHSSTSQPTEELITLRQRNGSSLRTVRAMGTLLRVFQGHRTDANVVTKNDVCACILHCLWCDAKKCMFGGTGVVGVGGYVAKSSGVLQLRGNVWAATP